MTLDRIRAALATHVPSLRGTVTSRRAAVAVVLRTRLGEVEVLLIERASRPDDPWSGHMAFPGGFVDPGDRDARQAAMRETLEEVSLDLTDADPIGRLDDVEGAPVGRPALVISAFVYATTAGDALRPNYEVREALWVPLRTLLDGNHATTYAGVAGGTFPAVLVGIPGRQVVWGLTYHLLGELLALLGCRFPAAG